MDLNMEVKCEDMEVNVKIEPHDIGTEEENRSYEQEHIVKNEHDLENDIINEEFTQTIKQENLNHRDIDKMHDCNQCGESFTQINDLGRHKITHTGEKPSQCNLCDMSFKFKSNLIKHMEIEHQKYCKFQCHECNKRFTSYSYLVSHKRIHKGEKLYQCSECEWSFTQKANLIAHQRVHTREKPYQCNNCDMNFTLKSHLTQHQVIHTEDKDAGVKHQCNYCEMTFTQKLHLNQHQVIHTEDKDAGVKQYCEMKFTQQSHLNQHQILQCKLAGGKHQCKYCEKNFTQKTYLNQHQILHNVILHASGMKYQCKDCDMNFNQKLNFIKHQKLHSVDIEAIYRCKECNKRFTSYSYLVSHKRSHEGEDVEVKIEPHDIGTEEENRSYEQEHIVKIEHDLENEIINEEFTQTIKQENLNHRVIEKMHDCNQCGESFIQINDLGCHMITHTGVKPSQCNVRDMSFKLKSNPIKHKEIEHQKPQHQELYTRDKYSKFQCKECKKSFTSYSYLVSHKRIHKGEKLYQCSECKWSFTQKKNLIAHQRVHTRDKAC